MKFCWPAAKPSTALSREIPSHSRFGFLTAFCLFTCPYVAPAHFHQLTHRRHRHAQVLPEAQWKSENAVGADGKENGGLTERTVPTGRVVGIIKRNWRVYCGHLDVSSRRGDSYLFVPMDKRIPRIRITTRQGQKLFEFLSL